MIISGQTMKSNLTFMVVVAVFFLFLSIPMDFVLSSIIGVGYTTIIDTALYIILASAAFFAVFYKEFY